MRLIDADALKKEWSMGLGSCNDCPQNTRRCQLDMDFTRMDICGMIDDAPTVGGWISVKDRLPETRHAVLVYTPHYKNIWAASMHEDGNWCIWSPHSGVYLDPDWHGPITHWMPLPEPPKSLNRRIKMMIVNHDEAHKDCFSCANAFVDDNDNLHCMADGHNHEDIVKDDDVCEDWN